MSLDRSEEKWKKGEFVELLEDFEILDPITHIHFSTFAPKGTIGKVTAVVRKSELIVVLIYCSNGQEGYIEKRLIAYFAASKRTNSQYRTSLLKKVPAPERGELPIVNLLYSRE
ncbi:hypothetical protein A3F08_02370 [Candidatus Berkelbacteria bacterium RIFCSPHIGHO2_12_FULL_36_9]|uniref:Uncharacterized protein n=1 Tax=Candidatus Berkelbacteria bacterium RIFCSPHIGHO2_12_FULL_36_9 TaxID=1797469 RepID=A0A1F5EKM9_9BACT|nr:MAG: hypothetical protein A3F08_02370 [Candidatus Berkelbacteria bacterium RIFCSPHIGHO2_12_FULL_36_9]